MKNRFTQKITSHADFKIGLTKDLRILCYEVDFYQNAGAAADLSPAVMERTMFHATNAYFVPNVSITAYSCRTNLPPNTAFRGFGGPQGMFVMESAIAQMADHVGVKSRLIQEKNLLSEGDEMPYGQIMEKCQAKKAWKSMSEAFNLVKMEDDVDQYNQRHTNTKKGLAFMPVCFGISFTNTPMNQSRALVHVYQDGSIGVSTGGVEMGQGINTKMVQVAMDIFSVGADRVKIETTNTTRVANTSPSAASSTSDLNGKALEKACIKLRSRLIDYASRELKIPKQELTLLDGCVNHEGKATDLDWEQLVINAHLARVNLTENGHYATPVIHFDKKVEKGHPFAYHVFGTAAIGVTVDCIRGIYEIDFAKIVHDYGKSMNFSVDNGQIEGGLVQGIGWMTMEELMYDVDGRLLSNALSSYKIPDIYSVPKEVEIEALKTSGHEMAIRRSKAVGEPPLMYGIGAYFAIENAIKAFNATSQAHRRAPFTPERVLLGLYPDQN